MVEIDGILIDTVTQIVMGCSLWRDSRSACMQADQLPLNQHSAHHATPRLHASIIERNKK